ncbi:MAG: hypothetical protein ACRDJC_26320 [Thermomicrobiales bacterium]
MTGSVVAALVLAGAACGDDEQAARSLRVDAARDGSLRFDRTAVRTVPGRVSIEMANPSSIPHAIGIRGNGTDETGATVGTNETSRIVADLRPGRYTLVCPVGAHQQAGMTATLDVG